MAAEEDEEEEDEEVEAFKGGLLEEVEKIGAKLTSALETMKDDSKKVFFNYCFFGGGNWRKTNVRVGNYEGKHDRQEGFFLFTYKLGVLKIGPRLTSALEAMKDDSKVFFLK